MASVGAFARSLAGQFKMPKLEAPMTIDRDHNVVTFKFDDKGTKPTSTVIWKADSMTKDFRPSKWTQARIEPNTTLTTEFNPNIWTAMFVEAKYTVNGRTFTLSTPVQVVGQVEPKG